MTAYKMYDIKIDEKIKEMSSAGPCRSGDSRVYFSCSQKISNVPKVVQCASCLCHRTAFFYCLKTVVKEEALLRETVKLPYLRRWFFAGTMERIMTRWDVLRTLLLNHDARKAIGNAWPLFFFIVFNSNQQNKCITSYPELHQILIESPNTIKFWRDCLVKQNVLKVIRGRSSMTLQLLSPYDTIVTCLQDDEAMIKMHGDPATKKLLEKVSAFGNMSLLPLVAELSSKLEMIEKKIA